MFMHAHVLFSVYQMCNDDNYNNGNNIGIMICIDKLYCKIVLV